MPRLLKHAATLLLGAAVALAAVGVHRLGPLGLLLAVGATFAAAWALSLTPGAARLPASYAAGWLVVFASAVLGRPEGDFAVASDAAGYVLVASGFVLLLVGAVAATRPHQRGSGSSDP